MHLRPALAALSLTALLTTLAAPAHAATPVVVVDPPKLAVGTTTTAHLDGHTIVDGATRIEVPGANVRLLGESGTGYVVESTKNDLVSVATVLRYAADGTSTRIGRTDFYSSLLSDDGQTVVTERSKRRGPVATRLTAYDATTGAVVAKHRVDVYANLLDADAGRVVIGSFGTGGGAGDGTSIWTLADNVMTRITKRTGQAADLRHDLLASYTKDPYEGGRTVLTPLTAPGTTLWSSRKERVEEFSTDGSRMALVATLDDGIGPSAIDVRSTTGTRLVTYAAGRRGYFLFFEFDSPTSLVLDANGPRKRAMVRCDDATCVRIGSLSRTQY